MNREQFESIINKVDFFKTDDNKIDYGAIVTILENFLNEYGSAQVFNQFIDAEYEVH